MNTTNEAIGLRMHSKCTVLENSQKNSRNFPLSIRFRSAKIRGNKSNFTTGLGDLFHSIPAFLIRGEKSANTIIFPFFIRVMKVLKSMFIQGGIHFLEGGWAGGIPMSMNVISTSPPFIFFV